MVFEHGVAAAASFGEAIFPWAQPGLAIREAAPYPQASTNNNATTTSSTYPTVNIFVDSAGADVEYVASIVTACNDGRTVYAARCTKGPTNLNAVGDRIFASCGANAPALTFTEGPSTYVVSSAVSTSTLGVQVRGSISEDCTLAGTTSANCRLSISASASGTSTSLSKTNVPLTGSLYRRYDVTITAGAEKTNSPGACPTTGAAASITPRAVLAWSLFGIAGLIGYWA